MSISILNIQLFYRVAAIYKKKYGYKSLQSLQLKVILHILSLCVCMCVYVYVRCMCVYVYVWCMCVYVYVWCMCVWVKKTMKDINMLSYYLFGLLFRRYYDQLKEFFILKFYMIRYNWNYTPTGNFYNLHSSNVRLTFQWFIE